MLTTALLLGWEMRADQSVNSGQALDSNGRRTAVLVSRGTGLANLGVAEATDDMERGAVQPHWPSENAFLESLLEKIVYDVACIFFVSGMIARCSVNMCVCITHFR